MKGVVQRFAAPFVVYDHCQVFLASRAAWLSSLITEIMTKGGRFISVFWPPAVLLLRHSYVVAPQLSMQQEVKVILKIKARITVKEVLLAKW